MCLHVADPVLDDRGTINSGACNLATVPGTEKTRSMCSLRSTIGGILHGGRHGNKITCAIVAVTKRGTTTSTERETIMTVKFRSGPGTAIQYVLTAPLIFLVVKFWNNEFTALNEVVARSIVCILSIVTIMALSDKLRQRIGSFAQTRNESVHSTGTPS